MFNAANALIATPTHAIPDNDSAVNVQAPQGAVGMLQVVPARIPVDLPPSFFLVPCLPFYVYYHNSHI
ncbi:MAG: hypothetical protein A2Z99_01715 [Treponema sp. GWB1_62_6]|nr:MAG: hypothetical protein A2Y36_08505 [Treponema sp. GWA1_62_8]OHE64941.1 MAG: hypothetical protein A2001_09630 [Treponema sp. GWC1_61_84]OHE72031.1 MAG: hypothetical protein A2Z99_01715 [Treponema sp. GWB1_62_6]OHE75744.1 MAG: hypothetical protein A2413_04615 [Treponema sp. RIFOXYC1_FULL_61_9]HCM28111.1 hypothetical protein [Treponema sp.]